MNASPILLTKKEACGLLGVSLATFDRIRTRLGIEPMRGVRLKPIVFDRAEILRAAKAPTQPATVRLALVRGAAATLVQRVGAPAKDIVSMKRLHAESAKGRKARGK